MNDTRKATSYLIGHALSEIRRKYGYDGVSPKAYHNEAHTKAVIASVEQLSNALGLEENQTMLLKIAAAFHDIVHNGESDQQNEQNSANYAKQQMNLYTCFSDRDIGTVVCAILATKCSQKYPKIVQMPRTASILDQLVCDADLSSFGKPFDQFIESANSFFLEINPGKEIGSDEYIKYCGAEVIILGNHRYWTEVAKTEYPHTKENIARLIHDFASA